MLQINFKNLFEADTCFGTRQTSEMGFFVKIVDRFSLFLQKTPSQMFDRVITHTSVKIIRLLQKQPAEMFHEKAFLKNCATFTGKPLCWSLSLIKLQPFWPASLLKRGCNTGVFCEYCEIFKNTYFEEKIRTAASCFSSMSIVLWNCSTLIVPPRN